MPLFSNRKQQTHAELPNLFFSENEEEDEEENGRVRADDSILETASSELLGDDPSLNHSAADMNPHERDSIKKVIIVGAGPSGLAAAACLRARGVPLVMVERSSSIASLWKERTYDRLKMHIAKEYCRLPLLPFPDSYPRFISKKQFLEYLDGYATRFKLRPRFQEMVTSAWFDKSVGAWVVETTCSRANSIDAQEDGKEAGNTSRPPSSSSSSSSKMKKEKYVGKWLVVASGENAEMVLPDIAGSDVFRGRIVHSSEYRNGSSYCGQKVLVMGAGNSGMEISLDLSNFGAKPSIIVRSPMHILPLEILGRSTFSVAQRMLKARLSLWLIDHFLVSYSRITLGDTSSLGIHRPKIGPMALKLKQGKTPVLDVGTLARIRDGRIKVVDLEVERITEDGVLYKDGQAEKFDSIVFATGYRSNVLDWLKVVEDDEPFFTTDSTPRHGNPNHWKATKGLYVAGLSKRGLLGSATDAELIAEDISNAYFNHSAATYMK